MLKYEVATLLAVGWMTLPGCGTGEDTHTSLPSVAVQQPNLPASDVTFSFARASEALTESAGPTDVAVVLHTTYPALQQSAQVMVVDAGMGTATSGSDYTSVAPQAITFPAGSVNGDSQPVTFEPIDDLLVEGITETVMLRLQDPTNGRVTSPMTHTISISDANMAEIGFVTSSSATLNENAAAYPIGLELELDAGVRLGVSVSVRVLDLHTGSARSPADYSFTDISISFPIGSRDGAVRTVDVQIIDDSVLDDNETVVLGLSQPSASCNLGPIISHMLTIEDDDVLSNLSFQISEGETGIENALGYDELVNLGSQSAGGGPTAGTIVRVLNGGATNLELGAPDLTGTHPNDFVVEIESTNTPIGTFTSGIAVDARQAPLAPLPADGPGLVLALDAARLASMAPLDHVSWHGFALPAFGTVTLELKRERLPFAEDAVLKIDGVPVPGGLRTLVGDLALWSGGVEGIEGSRVFLALDTDGAHGYIDLGPDAGGLVEVFTEAPGRVRLLTEAQLASLGSTPPAELCAGERFAPGQVQIQNLPETPDSSALTMADCRLALETDYQLYQVFGSSGALTDYVTALIGAVSAQFVTDVQTTLSIAYLGIHTGSNDGWSAQDTGGDAGDVLDEFRTDWRSGWPATADLAHFLSGANLGGGVAYVDVLCNPNFGFGVSGNISGNIDWGAWTGAAGDFTWDFMVVAHELGHNFGSQHTHDYCPPLDRCYTNCNGSTTCTRGTIMSYCHVCGGMSNIDLWFHPVTADIMRANVNTSCLDAAALLPGDFINYRVRFNPLTATGARAANLLFEHNATDAPQPFQIRLSGTAN
jgi:hypothetical protein